MSIHDGHRKRVKDRFRSEGLDHFDEVHVLELLLFYCVPRKDTNPLAHQLLNHFGSLTRVLEATADELEKVDGINEGIATFLTLIPAANRYYDMKKKDEDDILHDLNKCGEYLRSRFKGKRNEMVYVLCLDAKCKVLCCKEIGEGSVNMVSISARKVAEAAMAVNATSVILAHNHPSGLAIPSDEDILTTHRIARGLRALDIYLADHLVFADGDFTSMVQSGKYSVHDEWFLNERR